MNVITVQCSPKTDNIIDGEEYTQRPYPFYVLENGEIASQELWKGNPLKALGFAKRLDVHRIDVHWTDAYINPSVAIGMYLITEDKNGTIGTHVQAVESVRVIELPEEYDE